MDEQDPTMSLDHGWYSHQKYYHPIPYSFEPEYSQEEIERQDQEAAAKAEEYRLNPPVRLQSNSWCQCNNCQIMPKFQECVCCAELQDVFSKAKEQDKTCIIDHSGFHAVCLDKEVLWATLVANDNLRDIIIQIPQPVPNSSYRKAAYRMLRWWVHKPDPKDCCKDVCEKVPSCAVLKIRETFPEPSGVYTESEGPAGEREDPWTS